MTLPPAEVIIADDEALAREKLRRMLACLPGYRLIGEARTGPQAVALISALRPAVILLDIRLPGLNGFEVLARLGQVTPQKVIFVTASGDHAVEAFRAGAVDYLLKPFDQARLTMALSRAKPHASHHWTSLLSPPTPRPNPHSLSKVVLRLGGRTVLVPLEDIEYAVARNTECEVWSGRQTWRVHESLGSLGTRLPPQQFVRISRFALVNVAHVRAMRTKSHGDQIIELRRGIELTVARTRRREVLERLALDSRA